MRTVNVVRKTSQERSIIGTEGMRVRELRVKRIKLKLVTKVGGDSKAPFSIAVNLGV